jgi:HPt (histidine-containing phosphotransfer) domain-containing protein
MTTRTRSKTTKPFKPEGLSTTLDVAYLHEQTFGDEALARELLTLFSVQAGQLLHQVREAMQGETCCEAVHKLSGSARAIGAWNVAEFASDVEYELLSNHHDLTFLHESDVITQLEQHIEAVQAAIALYIAGEKSGALFSRRMH